MALQKTLRNKILCKGIGLHSGSEVTMCLKPAPASTGIVFRRTDVDAGRATVPARYDLVSDTRLGTTIRNRFGVSVSTVEHLMAALWGAGVDNAIIELDAPEVPIMDGSSEPFSALIEEAGLKDLAAPRYVIRILKEVTVQHGESVARFSPRIGGDFTTHLDVEIDFDHALISRQRTSYDFGLVDFREALAQARTFGFAHEVEQLRQLGLALGGSLENAIVVGKDRILNEEGLRFDDEFIRHKALDCMGDLYLAGAPIEGSISFSRPGHGINNKALRALFADPSAWELVSTEQAPVVLPVAVMQREVAVGNAVRVS